MVGWQSGQLHLAVNQAVRLRWLNPSPTTLHWPGSHCMGRGSHATGDCVWMHCRSAEEYTWAVRPWGSTPPPASSSRLQSVNGLITAAGSTGPRDCQVSDMMWLPLSRVQRRVFTKFTVNYGVARSRIRYYSFVIKHWIHGSSAVMPYGVVPERPKGAHC